MKHIIIEGGDRLGKNSIIESLCEHYNYNNISIRHFDKPPKGLSPKACLDFQFKVFNKEAYYLSLYRDQLDNDDLGYHENIVIWNRSHLGEYVYAQMFRGIQHPDIRRRLLTYEQNCGFDKKDDMFLISLTSSPTFFLKQEDGESFSQTLVEKTNELHLFKSAHNASIIKNKKLIQVSHGQSYRNKDIIFGEVLELLNVSTSKLKENE